MEKSYCVVLTGQVVSGRELSDVHNRLASLFKTTVQGIPQLLSKAPVMIKSNVDHDTALKYKAAVESAGALCDFELSSTAKSGPATVVLDKHAATQAPDVYAPPSAARLAHDLDVMESIRLSLRGCLKNWMPLLVVGPLIWMVLTIPAVVTAGLALLVLTPVLLAPVFFSYRDIYTV